MIWTTKKYTFSLPEITKPKENDIFSFLENNTEITIESLQTKNDDFFSRNVFKISECFANSILLVRKNRTYYFEITNDKSVVLIHQSDVKILKFCY